MTLPSYKVSQRHDSLVYTRALADVAAGRIPPGWRPHAIRRPSGRFRRCQGAAHKEPRI